MCFSHGTTSCRVTVRYFATKTFKKKDIKCDKNERPLLLDAKIDDQNYVQLNIYNANIENEQLRSTLSELYNMLNNVNSMVTKQIILSCNLNFYFGLLLEAKGGNRI